MNKTLLYLILALALGFGAWWTIERNQQKSTLEKLDLNFAVPDTASISKIIITEKPGITSTFERSTSQYWRLNGRVNAAPQMMEMLLSTIRNLEMKRPLARAEKETILNELKTRYTKVEIFVAGEPYKTYYIGNDAPGYRGTYMKLEHGDPYVCFLRGHNGFLTPRYHVEEHQWRDRLIMSSTPQTLQSVSVQYAAMPVENFTIRFEGKHFHMEGSGKMDTLAVVDYLLKFKKIYAEQFLKNMDKRRRDSLLRTQPEWTLQLEDIDPTRSLTLNFYATNDLDRTIAYDPVKQEMIAIQNRNIDMLKVRRSQLVRR